MLEPAAGDGALLKPIQTSIKKIDAIEYQKSEAEKIKENTQNPNITVYADDFLIGLISIMIIYMMPFYLIHHILDINI